MHPNQPDSTHRYLAAAKPSATDSLAHPADLETVRRSTVVELISHLLRTRPMAFWGGVWVSVFLISVVAVGSLLSPSAAERRSVSAIAIGSDSAVATQPIASRQTPLWVFGAAVFTCTAGSILVSRKLRPLSRSRSGAAKSGTQLGQRSRHSSRQLGSSHPSSLAGQLPSAQVPPSRQLPPARSAPVLPQGFLHSNLPANFEPNLLPKRHPKAVFQVPPQVKGAFSKPSEKLGAKPVPKPIQPISALFPPRKSQRSQPKRLKPFTVADSARLMAAKFMAAKGKGAKVMGPKPMTQARPMLPPMDLLSKGGRSQSGFTQPGLSNQEPSQPHPSKQQPSQQAMPTESAARPLEVSQGRLVDEVDLRRRWHPDFFQQ